MEVLEITEINERERELIYQLKITKAKLEALGIVAEN